MAKGKYKNKHKHANRDNNIFRFILDEKTNDQIINEIRKFDKNEEVENGYKKLVGEINSNGMYFFNNYKNTIPNHIVGRIFVSNLAYKLDEFKKQKSINKWEYLFELGFNGKKVMSAISTSINVYPTPASIEFLKQVAERVDQSLKSKNLDYGFGFNLPIERLISLSFERFYRVSNNGAKVKRSYLQQKSSEDISPKSASGDLEFLKSKALLINKAETIEEVLDTANQILKLAEILNENHGV